MIVTPSKPVSSYSLFFEKEHSYARSLNTFGDIGVMANQADKKIRGKLADRGKLAMFIGYPENHASDICRMFKLNTEQHVKSRDVPWLNKSYVKYHSKDAHDFDDDDFVETPDLGAGRVTEAVAPGQDVNVNVNVETTEDQEPAEIEPLSTRQMREMRQLSGFFNPDAQRALDSVDRMSACSMRSGSTISTQENTAPTPTTAKIGDTPIDELFDAGNFGFNFAMFAGGADNFEEPRHYDDAWNNPDPEQQTKWRKAISKEFETWRLERSGR
jgi:hypothetical protein